MRAKATGAVALAALVALTTTLGHCGAITCPALVEANRTFSLTSVGEGAYHWSLVDGRPAQGTGIVKERMIEFQRSDLVEISLRPDLETGATVAEGEQLVVLRSVANERGLLEIKAQRNALESQRALLRAGGRDEEVREAARRLDLARSVSDAEQAKFERTRALAATGAIAGAELEAAGVLARMRELEVHVAQASLDVVRASARPEALDALDAQIAAMDERSRALEDSLDVDLTTSPLAGVLEVAGGGAVLKVYDLSRVYVTLPVAQEDRNRLRLGDPAVFRTPAAEGTTYRGEIVDIGSDAVAIQGVPVFWASAALDNIDGHLWPGMVGTISVTAGGSARGLVAQFLRRVVEPGA